MCEMLEARTMLSSIAFNGTSSYITSDRSGVPYPLIFGGYTVEAWVRRNDANRCETVISSGFDIFSTTYGFWFGLCNSGGGGAGSTVSFQSNPANSPIHAGNTPIPANVWTHIAATYGFFGEERLYINGELDALHLDEGAAPNPFQNNLYVGAWRNENFTFGGTSHYFWGDIAEARVWTTVRTQDQIRRSMHELIQGAPQDLYALWHLNGFPVESRHNFPTTSTILASGAAAPPVQRVVQIDTSFNRLPVGRSAAASVWVPGTNQGYLIGGFDSATFSSTAQITAVDMSTGNVQNVASLPQINGGSMAAYVPDSNNVYIFGGYENGGRDTIVKYDLTAGAVTTLAARLPAAWSNGTAVWHPKIKRVVLVGGYLNGQVTSTVALFDPLTESITTTTVSLPSPRFVPGVAYSPITDRIYVFGGRNNDFFFPAATTDVTEISIRADGTGSAGPLPQATLPYAFAGGAAIEDPKSHLIHIVGGTAPYVLQFDPRTGKTWRTMIGTRSSYYLDQSVLYSSRNRHALIIGGGADFVFGADDKVWRVPLGEGPAIPIERWDFVNDLTGEIDGDDRGVYVSGNGNTVPITGIDEFGTRHDYGHFSTSINDIAYSQDNGLWVGTSDIGAFQFHNGTITQYSSSHIGTNRVYSVQPTGPFFGTNAGIKFDEPPLGSFNTYYGDHVLAQTGAPGETWAVFRDRPPADTGAGPWRLGHLYFTVSEFGTPFYATSPGFPSVCGDVSPHANHGLQTYSDLTLDRAGNLWVVGTGRGSDAICLLSQSSLANATASNPPQGGLAATPLSNSAIGVDVDGDGRIWVGLDDTTSQSGGLTVYDTNGNTGLRRSDYNWLNAPISSRTIRTGGSAPVWSSSIAAVAGVDEKLWASKESGGLVSVAQRWEQLDDVIGNATVHGIWTVRGRTFFNLGFGTLWVLQPDGLTYDFRFTGGNSTHVVAGDGAGNIWLGGTSGPRLYTPTGFDDLTDRPGPRPTGNIYAIVEAPDVDPHDGKAAAVWLGGDSGVTLFDRNRFVTTFTAANWGLPAGTVESLLVDRAGHLWVGTTAGLARLSADRTTWTTFTTANGLPDNSIFDLAQLGDGRIAVSTANGLSLYNPAAPGFTAQSPPVSPVNLPLSIDELGRLWAGSALMTAAGWRGYWSTNSGLKYSTISDSATDGADRIWFSHAPNPGVSVRGTFLPPLKNADFIITGYSPTQGSSGTEVTINGLGLGANPSDMTVTVGGLDVEIISVADNQIRARLVDATTSGVVSVKIGTVRRNATAPFCAVPQFHATNPFTRTGGTAGMEIEIHGTNFDSDAKVQFGNGPARPVAGMATRITRILEVDDPTGQITVQNHCAGVSTTSVPTFRKILVSIPEIGFNQGIPGEIIQGKATLFQNYVSVGGALADSERVEIDEVQEYITGPSGFVNRLDRPLSALGVNPPLVGLTGPTVSQRALVTNSQNVVNMKFLESGENRVRTVLLRRGRTVAEGTTTVNVTPNTVLQVLLVPILRDSANLESVTRPVNDDLAHFKYRVFPFGTANVVWSDEWIQRSETFTLDLAAKLFDAAPALDRIRRRYNENPHLPDAQIVMGVVEPSLLTASSAPGYAFMSDVSRFLNTIGLDELDAACDAVNGLVNKLSLGLLGSGDGCKLDIPLYVGWISGDPADNAGNSPGQILAHEIGHTMGLVKPWVSNGAWLDNISHSVNDELPAGMECPNRTAGAFDWNKSFHVQVGINAPIVDPLGGVTLQFLPNNDGNANNGMRAKSMMSYACNDNANNTFFEPVDVTEMNHPLIPMVADLIKLARTIPFGAGSPSASPAADSSPVASAHEDGIAAPSGPVRAPAAGPDTSGPRLHVFGTLNTASDTGELVRMETYGEDGPLSPSFVTGYWLVQLDAAGNELARTGVAPLGDFEAGLGAATQLAFAATLLRHANTVRVELRHDATVLDVFAPGAAPPVVQIVQPATGVLYDLGPAVVQWTATDANGDPLEVSIEYSADNGVSWRSIGSASGSGSLSVPIHRLAIPDAGQGRFRVTASDGLRSAIATSAAFEIANQPPQVYIDNALGLGSALEGRSISLQATAYDGEDGPLDGARVRWDSNLDGTLGTGAQLTTSALSIGSHAITVWAFDRHGFANSDTIHLTVAGDYDFDGIDDASEAAAMLNPLASTDALFDADGDGLTLLSERQIGSNPSSADSDGDGRRDDAELVAGTNLSVIDNPPPADSLSTTVSELSLSIDLAAGTPLPQFNLGVFSRQPADWQLITDVDWLEATAATGMTPSSTLVRVQAYKLADGQHLARLRFDSATIGDSAIIPVTITVINRQAYFDIDGNGTSNATDCQAIQALVGRTFDDVGYDLDLDVDRDGAIESEDVGICQIAVSPTLPGDFDEDGDVDDHDIDLLSAEIAAGTHQTRFNLTSDDLVNQADATRLVEGILHTHFGDANLDGFVNRADAAIVTANFGWTSGPAWRRGNFNGDAVVDLVDLGIQQLNFGLGPAPSAGAAPAAPEAVVATRRLTGEHDATQPAVKFRANRRKPPVTPVDDAGSGTQSVVQAPTPATDIQPSVQTANRRPRPSSRSSRRLITAIVDELFALG
jgi:hypothetical protein